MQLELLQIRVNMPDYSGTQETPLASFSVEIGYPCVQVYSYWFSLNILLHTYPHTALLTILDIVRVFPFTSMYQNFNPKFTSLLGSLASVLPLMLPLFGIHFLKTFVHHPLLPLLERSSKPIYAKVYPS